MPHPWYARLLNLPSDMQHCTIIPFSLGLCCMAAMIAAMTVMWRILMNFLKNNYLFVVIYKCDHFFCLCLSCTNKVCILIKALIGDNAIVCFQMKAAEMRGRLNATEKRSSEPFNLSYWLPSNMMPLTVNSLINKHSLMPRS